MPNRDDPAKLRRKAVGLVREARTAGAFIDQPSGLSQRTGAARFTRLAAKAETALFRLIVADPDDPAPRIAYGDTLSLRSRAMLTSRATLTSIGRMATNQSIGAARGAVWAYDWAGFDGLDALGRERITRLAAGPDVRTEFTAQEGTIGLISAPNRLAAAADARFALADRLSRFLPRPPEKAITPGSMEATVRDRDRYYLTDELLVPTCRLDSCRGRDSVAEARILLRQALFLHQVLTDLGHRTPESLADAHSRHDTVRRRLPIDYSPA